MSRMYELVGVMLVLAFGLGGSFTWSQQPELVSVNLSGNNSGNFISGSVTTGRSPGISDNGRMVVFESRATDLVSLTDSNADGIDIFVRDMTDNQTTLVSVRLAGDASAEASSVDPVISGDGRWVAWVSSANDLVAEDTTGAENVFVRDLVPGTTMLVSVASNGTDGGNNDSNKPVISSNGRFVVFESSATDLEGTNNDTGPDVLERFRELTRVRSPKVTQ